MPVSIFKQMELAIAALDQAFGEKPILETRYLPVSPSARMEAMCDRVDHPRFVHQVALGGSQCVDQE